MDGRGQHPGGGRRGIHPPEAANRVPDVGAVVAPAGVWPSSAPSTCRQPGEPLPTAAPDGRRSPTTDRPRPASVKALDLPLVQLADLGDPYLAELEGRAREAEPLRRQWLRLTAESGGQARHGVARARLAVNLVAQGAHRVAEAELRLAEGGLLRWADAAQPEEACWQLAVVACAWTLAEAQLSVRVEPPAERAALALAACAQAVRELPADQQLQRARDLAPWALATASAWLGLLEAATPDRWQRVYEAAEPVLRPALQAGDAGAQRWFLDFALRVSALGPMASDLRKALIDAAVLLGGAPALDLAALTQNPSESPPTRLDALRLALCLPAAPGRAPDEGAASQRPRGARGTTPLDALLRLSRLPRTPEDRQRLAASWMLLAERLHPPGRRPATDRDAQTRRMAAERLRLSAAQLWAHDGRWDAVVEAMRLCAGSASGSASPEAWHRLVHPLATAPAARQTLERTRRRTAPLRRWLARQLPPPLDPVDEARWQADLASLDGHDAEALQLRREALRVAERDRGGGSVDVLEAMQALRDTLAQRDEAHPELEELHDDGLQLALNLFGPQSPEHWWWRGMRALWWHRLGHPQALLDAADEAEDALALTARSGDAEVCAALRALLEMARSLSLPARSPCAQQTRGARVQ